MDLTDLEPFWALDEIADKYEQILLEPKTVSGWLGLPGSQLPRETAKIIGQPSQPARKKGASARYSFQDAILMKLGRTLTDLGITPHRVCSCVGAVRKDFHYILFGYFSVPGDEQDHADEEFEVAFYLVGLEYPSGFKAVIITQEQLSLFLTASGIKHIEWREAISAAQSKRMEAYMKESKLPKSDLSMFRPRRSEDYRPPTESLTTPVKTGSDREEDLDKLAEEGYSYIERRDPGLPAIVQNVTQYLADQSFQLYRYIQESGAKTGP